MIPIGTPFRLSDLTRGYQIQRQEDDIRARMSTASDAFRKAVLETQTIRQEYFNFQLPRILRVRVELYSKIVRGSSFRFFFCHQALKESADEVDLGTQYHMSRYAYLFESVALNDGSSLAPTSTEEGQFDFITSSSL